MKAKTTGKKIVSKVEYAKIKSRSLALFELRVSQPVKLLAGLIFFVIACSLLLYVMEYLLRECNLRDAAYNGNVSQIKRLLDSGVDPDKAHALRNAKWGGHREAIELLERAGAKE